MKKYGIIFALYLITMQAPVYADEISKSTTEIEGVVSKAALPLMQKESIPGMAVGVTYLGKQYIFNYGVASRATNSPVQDSTLFEIGSISKTFTVAVATLAQKNGNLRLTEKVSKYLPEMAGTAFGDVELYHLSTHTAGGFPLQLPDDIKTNNQLISYLQSWQPAYRVGTTRTYANPSIGMLGYITAKSMGTSYKELLEQRFFPQLGLLNTFIDVPQKRKSDYAQGYTKNDKPARMTNAILSDEAYGVKSSAADILSFLEAGMGIGSTDTDVQSALRITRTGYFNTGPMTQDMIWEQYPYPVKLEQLLAGNSYDLIYKPKRVEEFVPPVDPKDNVFINKTGSTNGFGGYVAFVPSLRFGIVILANKNYPNEERISLAYNIMLNLLK